MGGKPTYEELEQQVMELEKQAKERKPAEETLREKATLLDNILRGSTDFAIATTDLDFKITYYNPVAEDLFGYTASEVIGKSVQEMHTKENVSPERFEKAIEEVRTYGEYRYSVEQETTAGTRYIDSRVVGITKPGGDLVGFVLFSQDNTESKLAVEKLREKEQQLQAIMDYSPVAIYVKDTQGRYIMVNREGMERGGYSRKEFVGKTDYDLFPKDVAIKFIENDQKVLESKTPVIAEEVFDLNDEKSIFWTAKFPLLNTDGIPYAICGISSDITDRKRAEEALRKARDDLEMQVKKRTADLVSEIEERKQAEEALKAREVELEVQTHNLKEANAALKILLRHRDDDKKEFEEKIISNVKEMVFPYIEKLKMSGLVNRQTVYLDIINSHLDDIIAPFVHKLSSKYSDLTPTEIKVAGFVKDGKTSKEIANLLIMSTGTVNFHRNNLRKKLGLRNNKTNLRSHLLSLI
jgi:PAS domain S-box-containing protein